MCGSLKVLVDITKTPVKLLTMTREERKEKRNEVLDLKAQGLSYRDIAKRLGISAQLAFYRAKTAPDGICRYCLRPLKK